jgi:hypothetical protein
MWVKSAVASQVRIYISDGVTTTYTSYHTGDGTWQWLSSTHAISDTATYLRIGASVESSAGNPAYVSGATAMISNIAPSGWRPTPTAYSTVGWQITGSQSTGTAKGTYMFTRPAILRYVQCVLQTAPTGGTTFKIDVNKNASTLLGSVIAFTASDKCAAKAVDGTYANYCFPGTNLASGTALTDQLSFDIDAVGSTIAGSDLSVFVRFLEYLDPFDSQKAV